MPEYLSPAEVDAWAERMSLSSDGSWTATLREMAAIVAAVATGDIYESGVRNQSSEPYRWLTVEVSEDIYIRARRLRGLE